MVWASKGRCQNQKVVDVVGGEKDHQIVDTRQHSYKLLEDVDVENCNIKVSHRVLGEGKDVVKCAEYVNHGKGKEGDEDVEEEEQMQSILAVGILADEGEGSHKMTRTADLHIGRDSS